MKNKGFSLVELIVVIAIMAILVGVAVPVYSSYIEKTQKAKDQQLVDEVAHALQVYSVADPEGSGWVILTPEGAIGDGALGTAAMEQIFGANWTSDLALSYDGWVSVNDFLGMDKNTAELLLGSSYLTGSSATELLGEVSNLTGAAVTMIDRYLDDPDALYAKMQQFFPDLADDFERLTNEDGGFDYDPSDAAEKEEFKTQLSNLMVLSIAGQLAAGNGDAPEGEQAFPVAQLSQQFALINGFANSEYAKNDPSIGIAYQTMIDAISAPNVNSGIITNAITDFNNEEASYYDALVEYAKGQGAKDLAAFNEVMKTIDAKQNLVTDDDLKDANLYTTGSVATLFDSYVSAAGIVKNMDPTLVTALKDQLAANPGSVAVYISGGVIGCTCEELYNK